MSSVGHSPIPLSNTSHLGTIVALEKQAGVLKEEHIPIVESVRDKIEKEWTEFLYL